MVARMVCRLYAVLPFVITPLAAAALAAIAAVDRGLAVLVACAAVAAGLRATTGVDHCLGPSVGGSRARRACFPAEACASGPVAGAQTVDNCVYDAKTAPPGAEPSRRLATAALFLLVVLAPVFVVHTPLHAGLFEAAIDLGLVLFLPRRVGRIAFELELFPDWLTSVVLIALFFVPVRALAGLARRSSPSAYGWRRPRGPYRVSVLLLAYEEERTVGRAVTSLRTSAVGAQALPFVAGVRVVLADSGSRDATRARARAAGVDAVVDCPPGKLAARHCAIAAEDCDLVVTADGDRAYDEDALVRLLAPFADEAVVASTGETHAAGELPGGSALVRRVLKMPFNGGNSAFFKSAYERVPHDPAVDQFRHATLWCEEEFVFPLRLATLGRVAYAQGCLSAELRPDPLIAVLRRHLLGHRLRTF
jgi:hypothetical protein